MITFIAFFFFSFLVSLFLPWWALIIPAFIFGIWLLERGIQAFFVGFLATGLAWFIQGVYIHFLNDAILSSRIAEMMGVGSPWLVLLLTFLIGGILGGLGALTGLLLKVNLKPVEEPAGT